jgi:hypothetical protein
MKKGTRRAIIEGEIHVLILNEGEHLVAQCLEYDITAQAKSIEALEESFIRAFLGQIVLALEHGEQPFANLAQAPAFYWNKFKEARKFERPLNISPAKRIKSRHRVVLPPNQKAMLAMAA